MFTNERFRVYTHDDMVGVELAGALKNVAALCCGVSDGLGLGDNTKALLITRAMAETSRLAECLGGRKETLAGLAGMGDLIVTCTSMHSRNRRAGIAIGEGRTPQEVVADMGGVVEGYYAAVSAKELADSLGVEMPICEAMYDVLYNGAEVRGMVSPADEPRAEARNRQRMGINRKAVSTDRLFQQGEKTMCLLEQLERYEPYNEQEARDRALLLRALREEADVFTRENDRMHMTASAWVTNEAHDGVLMAYHNIYDSWAWLGGHADGEEDLLAVALREVREESGVKHARPASENIFSLEVLTVDGHEKRGAYVSSHLHLNVTYLLIADDSDALTVKPDENSGVRWFTPEGAIEASSEPWFRERIYKKLNAKLAALR